MTITIFVIYRPAYSNLADFLSDYYKYFTNYPIDDNKIIL